MLSIIKAQPCMLNKFISVFIQCHIFFGNNINKFYLPSIELR